MKIKKLIPYNNQLFFGRANSAIWMMAKYLKEQYKKPTIIFPSSMCVSPVLIFFLEKYKIKFVDINLNTGLMNLNEVLKITKKNKKTILFYVNLFGNFEKNYNLIKKLKKKNVYIIQDIAQTLVFPSKKENHKMLFGDVLITSFGYSKIFDFSHGSYLYFNNSKIHEYSKKFSNKYIRTLPQKKVNLSKNLYLKWYNKIYLKNKKINYLQISKFAKFIYLVKPNKKIETKIIKKLDNLNKEFKRRQKLFRIYSTELNKKKIKAIFSKKNFMPWRFCFLLDKNRDYIINKVRERKYDISSYYPNIGKRFNNKKYSKSEILEKKVVNLWLDKNYTRKKVIRLCKIINNELI